MTAKRGRNGWSSLMTWLPNTGVPKEEGKLSRSGTEEQNGHLPLLDSGTQGPLEGKQPPLERL